MNQQAQTADQSPADDLRRMILQSLMDAQNSFFDGAPAALNTQASIASTAEQRGACRDSIGLLKVSQRKLAGAFQKTIEQQFVAQDQLAGAQADDSFSVDELSLQEPHDLERNIVFSRITARVNRRFESRMREIIPRLQGWASQSSDVITEDAISPVNLCECFQSALSEEKFELAHYTAILSAFESLFVPGLDKLYERLEKRLIALNIKANGTTSRVEPPVDAGTIENAAGASAGEKPDNKDAAGGRREANSGSNSATALDNDASALDPQTLKMLAQVGQQKSRRQAHYGDRSLAQDLSAIAHGQPAQGWSRETAADSLRRAQAIGRVFNELQGDRNIPAELKPKFDSLRFAVTKSALSDAQFFADPEHPLRRLLNDLTKLAAESRISGKRASKNIAQMISEIQTQFEITADQAKPDPHSHDQADDSSIENFVSEQRRINKKRREEIIAKSRELVQEELWLRTAQREIPASGRRACAYGWVPMMALKLLRNGSESKAWKGGLTLLDRLVEGFDPRPGVIVEMAALSHEFRENLHEVGMVESRIQALIRDTVEALCEGANNEPSSANAPPPVLSATEILDRLLVVGQWFKLTDPASGKHVWVRVKAHDADEVKFEKFNGELISVPTPQFIKDLQSRRSEPVDPHPAAERALSELLVAA